MREWLRRLARRFDRALNRCNYCPHDRRSVQCCGIVYLPDRTEDVERHARNRRCDCEECWPSKPTCVCPNRWDGRPHPFMRGRGVGLCGDSPTCPTTPGLGTS